MMKPLNGEPTKDETIKC